MPRQRVFDKKTSTTYALVHRPQHDPLIHDPEAPQQVFTEISGPSKTAPSSSTSSKSKVKHRGDLEDEFGLSSQIRANEGEAAEHGVFFDDTKYDYMQHLRDLGQAGDATWVESQAKTKAKGKQRLEDALEQFDLAEPDKGEQQQSLAETDASARYKKQTYQDQQDVPDAIRGFQPDMDPRLREVLEALEDEEYVDDDEDIFTSLTGEGDEEVTKAEWEAQGYQDHDYDDYDDEDDGWESDETTKPATELKPPLPDTDSIPATALEDGAWFAEFTKSKQQQQQQQQQQTPVKKLKQQQRDDTAASSILDTSSSAALFNGTKHKKRKGALTSSTGFSMTSSALARTEPLSTLDSRFDKLAESYLGDVDEEEDDEFDVEDDENASVVTGMTTRTDASRYSAFGGSQASEAPSLVPAGFNSVLDNFLTASGSQRGRGRLPGGKKGGGSSRWAGQSGMQQLDEVRRGLGPARVKN